MKILVDHKTKEIVGATILGIGGDEISTPFWMSCTLSATAIQRAMHIHPTATKLISTLMLGDLSDKSRI